MTEGKPAPITVRVPAPITPRVAAAFCCQFFGQEILLPEMEPGNGIRACCLLFKGHEGEHAIENPDLKGMSYETGDLG